MEVQSLDTRAAVVGWPVFRDGHVRRFLFLWIERQIARLGLRLETVNEEDLKNVQGQIAGLRSVCELLNKTVIDTTVKELD